MRNLAYMLDIADLTVKILILGKLTAKSHLTMGKSHYTWPETLFQTTNLLQSMALTPCF